MKKNLFISIKEIEEIIEIMDEFNKKEYICSMIEINPGRYEIDDHIAGNLKLTMKSLELVLNAPLGLYYLFKEHPFTRLDKFKIELKKEKGYWIINN